MGSVFGGGLGAACVSPMAVLFNRAFVAPMIVVEPPLCFVSWC